MKNITTSTCSQCGEDFTGGFVAHKIKTHARAVKTTHEVSRIIPDSQARIIPAGVTPRGFLAAGYHSEDTRPVKTPARVSPVRVAAAKSQVTTPKPSAKSERADSRRAVPARERKLRTELRQARRSLKALQARMDVHA